MHGQPRSNQSRPSGSSSPCRARLPHFRLLQGVSSTPVRSLWPICCPARVRVAVAVAASSPTRPCQGCHFPAKYGAGATATAPSSSSREDFAGVERNRYFVALASVLRVAVAHPARTRFPPSLHLRIWRRSVSIYPALLGNGWLLCRVDRAAEHICGCCCYPIGRS